MSNELNEARAELDLLRWEASLPHGGVMINTHDIEAGLATWEQLDDQLAETLFEEDLA